MPLIEGMGDEVVQFVAVVLVILVATLAWWSTNARSDRYRAVVVMRSGPRRPATVNITRSLMVMNAQVSGTTQTSTSESAAASTSRAIEAPRENARVIPLQEMDSIVDADMAMLDNNRLHFYRRIDSPSTLNGVESGSDEGEAQGEGESEVELSSTAQMREMDSIVSAMEADVNDHCHFFATTDESNTNDEVKNVSNDCKSHATSSNISEDFPELVGGESSNDLSSGKRRKILIKLKYLNDTLKEVEGCLDELLKDFKWRHFSSELSSECRVRLIFQGRVLADEAATLRACGLHHRAVVHCLVHPKRHAAHAHAHAQGVGSASAEEGAPGAGVGVGAGAMGGAGVGAAGVGVGLGVHEVIRERPPDRAWDLENILMTLVSVALTVVWFFRCEYSNMFTASASVALFGLTVFYSVAIFGLYLSDTFQFNRPQQPVPNI